MAISLHRKEAISKIYVKMIVFSRDLVDSDGIENARYSTLVL